MRVVTRKIYRAFPELDQFSDEQCQNYVRRVSKSITYIVVTAPAALVAFGVGLIGALAVLVAAIAVLRESRAEVMRSMTLEAAMTLTSVVLVIMAPALLALRVRDHLLWRFISRQVGKARCLGCEYSLLGQRIVEDSITCPECGRKTSLKELGLHSAAELIPPGHARSGQVVP